MFDYDFVSLGGYVLDLYIPVPEFPVEADRTYRVLGKTVEQEAGGSVGNITIMASRLGLKTTTVAYLGQDPYGRHIHDTLQAEGVDVGYLEFREDLYTPLVVVLSDAKGKHSYVTNLSHGNIREFPDTWKEAIKRSRLLYVCGYSLLDEGAAHNVLEVMGFAKENGVKVLFDPGALIGELHRLPEALFMSDILIPNEQEAVMISGGQAAQDAIKILHERFANDLTVVKLGPKGCLFMGKGSREVVHVEGFQVDEVLDTTGAGDSFAAAVAKGFLEGQPLEEMGRFANAVGAAVVQKVGSGSKLPTLDEILEVMENVQSRG